MSEKTKKIQRLFFIIIIIAIIMYLIFAIWFRYQLNQVNELNIKIENQSDSSVNLDIQIFDSKNDSIYQNYFTINPGKSFRTGKIIKKADRYHFLLKTDNGLLFDNYTNVDEGFHSPKFIITNSKIEINQIVE